MLQGIEKCSVKSGPIRVLVIDDSALVRKTLSGILEAANDIEVVGTAVDPFDAREKIKRLNPDVLTLDVEMPRMDGLTFLKNLMRLRPMPVVMISSLTEKGAEVTLAALEIGAVDFVSKPKLNVASTLEEYALEIASKVRGAYAANCRPYSGHRSTASSTTRVGTLAGKGFRTSNKIVAIGSSTGGTEAVREILERLPADAPGIVIAQHIPPVFSRSFADRLNLSSPLRVCEAADGQQILPGHAYVAPGDKHLRVGRSGARYVCELSQEEPVNRHRPSVDVLFDSVAEKAGRNALGVILTGMGADGARGLKRMKDAGAVTFAQDERSSVVWGMPGQAVKLGAASDVVSLSDFPKRIIEEACRTG